MNRTNHPKEEFQLGEEIGPFNIKYCGEAPPYIYLKTNKKYRQGYFECPICHSKFITRITKVKTGKVKSCGCIKHFNKGLNNGAAIDLTNKKFGKLTALEPTNKRVNGKIIWKCKCDCGNITYVASSHLQNKHTQSCGCIQSLGEQKISSILYDNNIYFERQKTFKECINPKTKAKLKFDFYLPDYNCCIEYDGEQHFILKDRGWYNQESLEDLKERDKIKDNFCQNNGILLYRIPYTDLSNISTQYLQKILNSQPIVNTK